MTYRDGITPGKIVHEALDTKGLGQPVTAAAMSSGCPDTLVGATPQSVVGNLTWNPNGSLGTLAITDAFNGANTQTCTYSHDDLARIASGNCGSVWSQTFSYDAFGNITKAGTNSFNPGYNTAPPSNSCVTGALKSGAITVGIDALGFLPEAGGVARVVGHQAGYVGKVADNLGKNVLTAGTKTTGFLNSATGFSSSDWTTWVSAGITGADFVPVLSDFTTPAAMIWDDGTALYRAHQCP